MVGPRENVRAQVGSRVRVLLLATVLAASPCVEARAGENDVATPESRPRIGLVLSGGGARGGAHVGVLQVMEELRIPVDYIAGTSMGAIIGGLYAAGYSPAQMQQALQEVDWKAAFNDDPPRKYISYRRKEDDRDSLFRFELGVGRGGFSFPAGLIAGQKLQFILRSLTLDVRDVDDFDALPIPYRAIAADLETGEMVVLSRGDLAEAMRASMSIPGVFTPVELEDRVLVDGGIARNLPVDVARSMGADWIIAVNVGTPPGQLREQQSPFSVASRTMSVLSKRNVGEQLALLGEHDLLIVPDLEQVRTADFERIDIAVEQGLEAARLSESDLRRFTVSEDEYAAFLRRQRASNRDDAHPVTIDQVDVVGLERIDPRIVTRRITTRPGQALDLEAVKSDLAQVARIGEFEHVGFRLEPLAENHARLVIDVREKSWGPSYLRFGLRLDSDLEGQGDFSFLANYRRASVNRFGAEWKTVLEVGDVDRLFSEFYQPLGFSGFWFVAPQIELEHDEGEFFLSTGALALADLTRRQARFDLGLQFGHWGEFRVGVVKGSLDGEELSGAAAASLDAEIGGWRGRFTLDRLDNAYFPRRGTFARISGFFSRKNFGADETYDKLSLDFRQAWSIGRGTVFAKLDLDTDLGSGIPFYDQFRLGGFFNLSGLPADRLQGNVASHTALGYYWQIMELPSFIGGGVYVGGTLEAGNVWPSVDDAGIDDLLGAGLVFLGAETILGPVYLGYGRAEGGEDSFYLRLGRVFQ
jgi:NTE family protein